MKIKNVNLGQGQPKVVISFAGQSFGAITSEIREAKNKHDKFDIVEIRSDSFDALNHEDHFNLVDHIVEEMHMYPIIYTYRTNSEGGKGTKTAAEYRSLVSEVIEKCNIDIVDIEFFMYEDIVDQLIGKAKDRGVAVILSRHDFQSAPHFDEMMATYKDMYTRGGDILKIAYKPENGRDVLSVLSAVYDARQQFDCQVVGIAMGEAGKITRVAGGVFGSCLTYGHLVNQAAPGQIHAETLKEHLKIFDDD
ncbi:type I 3-dehydroquinate dehydratase [Salinicoccus albus]|uniref:type I 3-dehydroquinate dehydratase n=1 Tax=Salinicoccus albus TaxID=418756 RepID=UPI0003610F21|nr:type I 3-dehydroquinate dehydratase [Salinicoccus albus]